MKRKFRLKPLWIFIILWIIFLAYYLRSIEFLISEVVNVDESVSAVERVRVSDVIALNHFISQITGGGDSDGNGGNISYAYNRRLSDKIGAYRALPDTRDETCRARNYYLPRHGLKVSIIIAFHNEARSALVRTIMSIYRRTPTKYLHEIILVDDHSDDVFLLSTLQHLSVPPFTKSLYLTNPIKAEEKQQENPKVGYRNGGDGIADDDRGRIGSSSNSGSGSGGGSGNGNGSRSDIVVIKMQRNSRRLGLIESRNLGARLATGNYLLFLDSHCEVNVGWLEPLLARVAYARRRLEVTADGDSGGGDAEPSIAVSPVLDSIDAKTLQYRASSQQLMGGFDWNLHFHWLRRDRNEETTAMDDDSAATAASSAFKSPVFSGGMFMISRKWFLKLQGFNSLLQIWGGESIELSIKLWLCGGQIEIVPCSRVGHIFHKQHPFRFPNGDDGQETYLRNSKIIAESWMDFYKNFFYALKPEARNIPVDIPLKEIESLKQNLKCRPFAWYLSNVFPQLKLPNDDFIAFGKLSTSEHCLHVQQPHRVDSFGSGGQNLLISKELQQKQENQEIRLLMANCYHSGVTHWFLHRHSARLQSSNGACLNVARKNSNEAQTKSADMILPSNDSNTTAGEVGVHFIVVLQYCRQTARNQRWLRRGAQLIHERTHLCLDNPLNDVVAVSRCRQVAPTQLFHFTMEMQQL